MRKNLFAYGTLMFPEIARTVADLEPNAEDVRLRDYARYTVESRESARVPAIIPERGAVVEGKLYRDVSARAWELLDHFEEVGDGLYTREPVRVVCRDESWEEADTYVAGARIRSLLRGPWDADEFSRLSLAHYLERVLPSFLPAHRKREPGRS